MDKVQEIVESFKDIPGGLLEAMQAVQASYTYISAEAIRQLANIFGLPVAKVYGVATFYSFLSVKERGRNIIRICESAPCHVQGAAEIVKILEEELGIRMGETTLDQQFTLEFTQCVGVCEHTPVIIINGKPYGDLNPSKVIEVLKEYRQGL